MKRQIILTPHNPNWVQQYEIEAAAITAVLGDNLINIHHVGSTAIPDIQAKPIIDMMPVVWDIEQVDALNEAMAKLGYTAKGENGIPGRRYFQKGVNHADHTHHIHVFQIGHSDVARHLLFRDYMRAYPDQAQAYNQLKADLAETFRDDPAGYTNAKSDFIQAADQAALAWQQERERPLRTLITTRLQLIALSRPQLESCVQDPSLLAANLNLPLADDIFNPVVREASCVKVSKMRLTRQERHHWQTYWLIVRRDENIGIGTIGFKGEPDPQQYKVEIGYGLSAEHRQQGFMTEAARTLTRWALAQPDCLGVYATTVPDNLPSHRILERIGYMRNGMKDDEWLWEINY